MVIFTSSLSLKYFEKLIVPSLPLDPRVNFTFFSTVFQKSFVLLGLFATARELLNYKVK